MTFHWLHVKNLPIYEQLQLEEALLRGDTRNFCIINEGSTPAIVMGISGKPHELIDKAKSEEHSLPIIKRFSGGGTVVVDENTLFVTFISQKEIHTFPAYPEPILKWSEQIYKKVFGHDLFQLRENDYVVGEKKCGGNAQYIRKERWLHHTSFLWDYKPSLMSALLHPKKTPKYRDGRVHSDFLCCLKEFFPSKQAFLASLKGSLQAEYALVDVSLEDILSQAEEPNRKTTTLVAF